MGTVLDKYGPLIKELFPEDSLEPQEEGIPFWTFRPGDHRKFDAHKALEKLIVELLRDFPVIHYGGDLDLNEIDGRWLKDPRKYWLVPRDVDISSFIDSSFYDGGWILYPGKLRPEEPDIYKGNYLRNLRKYLDTADTPVYITADHDEATYYIWIDPDADLPITGYQSLNLSVIRKYPELSRFIYDYAGNAHEFGIENETILMTWYIANEPDWVVERIKNECQAVTGDDPAFMKELVDVARGRFGDVEDAESYIRDLTHCAMFFSHVGEIEARQIEVIRSTTAGMTEFLEKHKYGIEGKISVQRSLEKPYSSIANVIIINSSNGNWVRNVHIPLFRDGDPVQDKDLREETKSLIEAVPGQVRTDNISAAGCCLGLIVIAILIILAFRAGCS